MPAKSLQAEKITDRDQAIFQFLFESKVATGRQIHDRFFRQVSQRASDKRLSKLVRANWLNRGGYSNHGHLQNIYWIGESAYRKFVLTPGINDRRKQLKSDAVDHDLALIAIRERLEKCRTARIIPENVLQSHFEYAKDESLQRFVEIRSDMAVEFIGTEGHRLWIPLEYESSIKSVERCHKKLKNYYTLYGGKIVLFICRDEPTMKRMQETERELGKEYLPKMHFALLKNFLSGADSVTFTMIGGSRYEFG